MASGSLLKRLRRSSSRRHRRQRNYHKKKTGTLAVSRLVEAVSITDKLKALVDNLKASHQLGVTLSEIEGDIEVSSVFLSQKDFLAVNSVEELEGLLHLKNKCNWKGKALIRRADDDDEEDRKRVTGLILNARREGIPYEDY